jgi:hypothetical protein
VASIACLILLLLGYPRLQGVIAAELIKPSNEQAYAVKLPQTQAWGGLFTRARPR